MIKHVVCYKLKDNSEENKQRVIKRMMMGMKDRIPGLLSIEMGSDFMGSERSYDWVLIETFATRRDMDGYLAHPAHQNVRRFMKEVRTDSVAVDFYF